MNFMKKIILILIAIFLIVGYLRKWTTDIEKNNITALNTVKTWHNINLPQLDNVKLSLKTRWKDGNLYFIFTVMPPEKLRFYIRVKVIRFVLYLYDSDGFVIIKKLIDINDMDNIVDEQDEYIGLEINSSIPCTAEAYLSIKDWSCGWQLF
jgi:hypothetical protein